MQSHGGDIQARDYQINLVETALKQNTIVYLPTGTGKTFIAVMVLRQLAKPLEKSISQGGKISIMLVNTHALVNQQSQYLQRLTPFDVLAYGGKKNISPRKKASWKQELDKYQILVMTPKTLVNILQSAVLSLNDINLLIFDECHRAVNNHPMRQLMMNFEELKEPPRIVGLTATLVNKNCAPEKIVSEVEALQNTLRSKIATVEAQHIVEFSTNPKEVLKTFLEEPPSAVLTDVLTRLQDLINVLEMIHLSNDSPVPSNITHTNAASVSSRISKTSKGINGLIKLIKDTIIQIQMLGMFGGRLTVIVRIEQLEVVKRNCPDSNGHSILEAIITTFQIVKKIFENEMTNYNEDHLITKFSSQKVQVLLNVLKEYRTVSKEGLCGIIFVKRRFTAKMLYQILMFLKIKDPAFDYLRPNFVLGNNVNSQTNSALHSYTQTTYKHILSQFLRKEINLLVASNVLEEGVDIPICTLVVNFDIPLNYRAYIQSKGRARHKNSFYYLMIDINEYQKFKSAYEMYQQVEEKLNNHFTGQKNNRCGLLFDEDFNDPCGDYKLPTHYANNPCSSMNNSVSASSAVELLCQYCLSLPSDKYTSYVPSWYLEHSDRLSDSLFKVIIQLPTVCPLLDPIEGPYMKKKKLAKGAAALKACQLLQQLGELDNNFVPRRHDVIDEEKVFFKHWPKQVESDAGSSKKGKMYSKQIPTICRGQIKPNQSAYLHVIELKPGFLPDPANGDNLILQQLYSSSRCFGVLTSQALPQLCKFPVYVPAGEITVDFKVNQDIVNLTDNEISNLKKFHHFVFKEILEILQSYLVYNNDEDANILLVVPVLKNNKCEIDKDAVNASEHMDMQKLVPIDQTNCAFEKYVGKLITTLQSIKNKKYLITGVCSKPMASNGSDPTGNNWEPVVHQSLLVVRELSTKINHLKPYKDEMKVHKGNKCEGLGEYLVPEQCILQNFPSDLWIQAELVPSILHRLILLLQAEELRRKIAAEANIGVVRLKEGEDWLPLVVDIYVMNHKTVQLLPKEPSKEIIKSEDSNTEPSPITAMQLTLDALNEMIRSQFSWLKKDTPDDVEHNIDISFIDTEFCDHSISQVFITKKVKKVNVSGGPTEKIVNSVSLKEDIALLKQTQNHRGPELTEVFRALTTAKSGDIVNFERLEMLGDSFLKLSVSLFIILKYPHYNEGKASFFKGHLISNKNLHYAGIAKNLGGYLNNSALSFEWKPPSFCVPKNYRDKLKNKQLSPSLLMDLNFTNEEQLSGILKPEREEHIVEDSDSSSEHNFTVTLESLVSSLEMQSVSNKTVADSVEALLGTYFHSCGFLAGLKMLEWLNIIPKSQNVENLLSVQPPNPLLLTHVTNNNIDCHIPSWQKIEERLGYHFNNRAYLLQALTHSSYTPNRLTKNYQKLEFLGDAVLDFLITCYIYETCEHLNPGQLTDLRSALVNNVTFGSFTVRCGFHKFILFSNEKLLQYIDEFVQFQESKDFVIDDEVMVLFEENDLYLAEQIDVPKVLGDIFESLAAAIFLDSGMNFETVWKVFYPIMHKEIELFCHNIPKNPIRHIHESSDAQPKYHNPVIIDNGATMVGLDFTMNNETKTVYGFGENKFVAKKAAAKIALRLLAK